VTPQAAIFEICLQKGGVLKIPTKFMDGWPVAVKSLVAVEIYKKIAYVSEADR
jgi:hypothetical protein